MKVCSTCKQRKPLDAFFKHPTASGGLCYSCKSCMAAYNKRYKNLKPQPTRDPAERKISRKKYNESDHGRDKNREYSKIYKSLPRVRARDAQYRKQRVERTKKWIDGIKLERGCIDCGYRAHPQALDFDHLPGFVKLFNVSQSKVRAQRTLQLEMDKCELVCANCHRMRSDARRVAKEFE